MVERNFNFISKKISGEKIMLRCFVCRRLVEYIATVKQFNTKTNQYETKNICIECLKKEKQNAGNSQKTK